MKILFICTGNTCRSPMAEALLTSKLPYAEVQSAGLAAFPDQPPSETAAEALKREGITLDTWSNPVNENLLHWADLVLTMTTQHKQSLIRQYPSFQAKYFTLKEYTSSDDREIWEELKQRYAAYEEKRSQLLQSCQYQQDRSEYAEALKAHMQEEWQAIQSLEKRLTSYDIPDPFGGSLADYQKTLEELESAVNALVNKLHNQ